MIMKTIQTIIDKNTSMCGDEQHITHDAINTIAWLSENIALLNDPTFLKENHILQDIRSNEFKLALLKSYASEILAFPHWLTLINDFSENDRLTDNDQRIDEQNASENFMKVWDISKALHSQSFHENTESAIEEFNHTKISISDIDILTDEGGDRSSMVETAPKETRDSAIKIGQKHGFFSRFKRKSIIELPSSKQMEQYGFNKLEQLIKENALLLSDHPEALLNLWRKTINAIANLTLKKKSWNTHFHALKKITEILLTHSQTHQDHRLMEGFSDLLYKLQILHRAADALPATSSSPTLFRRMSFADQVQSWTKRIVYRTMDILNSLGLKKLLKEIADETYLHKSCKRANKIALAY